LTEYHKMWNFVNKLIFVFLAYWSCEAFPSVDDFSRSVSRKPNDRSVLINLAKTLSSSLQRAMTANNQKIESILDDQQEVMAAVEKIETEVNKMKKGDKNFDENFAKLESDVQDLKDRRNLDEMLWNFNTQVCNASIEMVKQEIDTKLSALKNDRIVNTNEAKKSMNEENLIGESFNTEDIFNTDNIFKEFENALAEYEDQDDYFEERKEEKQSQKKLTDPVGNLVAETNKFLMLLESKYNNLSGQIRAMQKLTAETKQIVEPNLEEKLNNEIVKLEAKFHFLLKNIQSLLEGADDDIKHDINMRMEDFNILRKTTTSRLAVYETRIDMLEQLVLKYSTQVTEPTIEIFKTTTEASTTHTTEVPVPAYEDLGGNDFSMLGINNPNDLDLLLPYQPKQDCERPPCDKNIVTPYEQSRSSFAQDEPMSDSKYVKKDKKMSIQRPASNHFGSLNLPPTFQTPKMSKNDNVVPGTCDCEQLTVKGLELEHEIKFLSAEVGSALAGMRSSLTTLLHRIEVMEKESKRVRQVSCVATKEALKMPGMDDWCSENCRKGNCPSHLCSCPTIIN